MKTRLLIRKRIIRLSALLLVVLSYSIPSSANDMRVISLKVKQDHQAAVKNNNQTMEGIASDRGSLTKKIKDLIKKNQRLKTSITIREKQLSSLEKKETDIAGKKSENESDLKELSGAVRVAAKNLDGVLKQSQFTAESPERILAILPVLDNKRFPGIDDMKVVSDHYLDEIGRTGGVSLRKGTITDRNGAEVTAEILAIGPFTAAYRTESETGLLNYSEKSFGLYALSKLPSWLMSKKLSDYMDGDGEKVFVDISRGAALRQITATPGLIERVKQGGILIWPILFIGLAALVIGVERIVYLKGVHANTDIIMGQVNNLADEGKWGECDAFVTAGKDRPVNNVLRSGLAAKSEDRETLESILQEAILKELPRLEKYLPMLNMMGSISPLLGLLGTVTGMITTFHVITLYGTGDPRMMSGGISTALVTTMLGLAVAIPIMLLHTFLNGRVEHIIGDMEEKAIALTNIINRSKSQVI